MRGINWAQPRKNWQPRVIGCDDRDLNRISSPWWVILARSRKSVPKQTVLPHRFIFLNPTDIQFYSVLWRRQPNEFVILFMWNLATLHNCLSVNRTRRSLGWMAFGGHLNGTLLLSSIHKSFALTATGIGEGKNRSSPSLTQELISIMGLGATK